MKKWLAVILTALLLGACFPAPGMIPAPADPPVTAEPPLPAPPKPEPVSAPPPEPAKATILAAGDNLIHDIIWMTAERHAGKPGEYDFRPLYANVQKQIAAADVASVNQETPLVASRPLSNFPLFNSPPALAAQLKDIGFDAVTVANNHMLDQGASGLQETLDALHAVPGLAVTGAFRTPQERDIIPVIEQNGLKFAFLGYTQFTNGLVLPKGQEFRTILTADREAVRRQLAAAQKLADVVVVNVHWGDEYSLSPNAYQKELAQFFADCGAGVIFGHHPHVLQPAAELTAKDGRRVPVFYSLGNFLSAQHKSVNLVGIMAAVTFGKDFTTGNITYEKPVITPVITHFNAGFGEFRLYPLAGYSDSLAAAHALRQRFGEPFSVDWIKNYCVSAFGEDYDIEGV